MSTSRPFAPTSFPATAEMREHTASQSYGDRDFSWAEDTPRRWRAVALFGGLVFLDGVILWEILTSGQSSAELTFAGVTLLLGLLGGLPLAFLGYTEAALAFGGGAVVGLVVAASFPLADVAGGYSTFANPGSLGPELAVVLGLQVAGAFLVTIGVVESVKVSRAISDEE
ncbi:MAG: hypothetical protein ACLPWO_05865 [Thermoplasmata archaeon]